MILCTKFLRPEGMLRQRRNRPGALARSLAYLASASALLLVPSVANAAPPDTLARRFVVPPDSARPWVYWYFMDGNITREGIHADLEAMKKAGIGGAIYLEVGIGIPRGPVAFMSPQWQDLFAYAVTEAKRLGLQIALGTGPGWAGSGGPWVTPELSMQHLVASETTVSGPTHFDAVLARPAPRTPFFGVGTLHGDLREKWLGFYKDEAVVAFPTPVGRARIADADNKALYYRAPYSSQAGTRPRLPAPADFPSVPAGEVLPTGKMRVLTPKMTADGRLVWDVPAGNWTVLRFGRTPTGQTTRPAPEPGLGFESDKFSREALEAHLHAYTGTLIKKLGPGYRSGDSGLTGLHFDSWEMGSQNWTAGFRQEFTRRRGYDPLPYLPALLGYVVDSGERSERFLWDIRQTAADLVLENHAGGIRDYAHRRGLTFSVEPYDMNPAGDLDLGATADLPMGEFWSRGYGFKSEYSCFEAVSVGHTNGRAIIGAESFTANSGDTWLQHPASMKAQLDWALCAGINKFVIHRYEHQPDITRFPGMTMGPYGVHWERTQTWWDMVPAFHTYMSRTSFLLRQGLPVADILYLTPEGAPQVLTPPSSALTDGLPDHKGYSFDGISPRTLMARASVKNGSIVFPDGMRYRLLVLPQWDTMTPALLRKITELVKSGATVLGRPPRQSPSLTGFPATDATVQTLATALWGTGPTAAPRRVGFGRIVWADALPKTPTVRESPLTDARWIWRSEGAPARSAPVATRYFRNTVEIDPNRTVKSAMITLTADNEFELSVNGHAVGRGDNFNEVQDFDIARLLKGGSSEIRVTVVNGGDTPNPAGLIASVRVVYADGVTKTGQTGHEWSASATATGPWTPALELGAFGMSPWNLRKAPAPLAPIYPDYDTTAKLLRTLNVAPDFSATVPLRYIHRKLADGGDLYFVANPGTVATQTTAAFRASSRQPQWWNPISGDRRDLPDFVSANGLTQLPLRLGPLESGFVVFRNPAIKTRRTGTGTGANFPQPKTLLTLVRPWTVAFDPKWGGPASTAFPTLTDWSKNSDPRIKYYSGKAVYSTTFDVPTVAFSRSAQTSLALGSVKNLASVRVNGRDLGSVWCDPWRVIIPAGLLRTTGNRLQVTVANLWVNRLIGDAGKPVDQQLTKTTFRPLGQKSPLQPSGLLGPVTLETTER